MNLRLLEADSTVQWNAHNVRLDPPWAGSSMLHGEMTKATGKLSEVFPSRSEMFCSNQRQVALKICENQLDVWFFELDHWKMEIKYFCSLLTETELEQANRMVRESDRMNTIIARALCRLMLGRYLNCSPQHLTFQFGAYGKPKVKNIEFNISHSKTYMVISVSALECGVDVEDERHGIDYDLMLPAILSQSELSYYLTLEDKDKPSFFIRCWTQKEAAVKALGTGLNKSLGSIDSRSKGKLDIQNCTKQPALICDWYCVYLGKWKQGHLSVCSPLSPTRINVEAWRNASLFNIPIANKNNLDTNRIILTAKN